MICLPNSPSYMRSRLKPTEKIKFNISTLKRTCHIRRTIYCTAGVDID
ncbi:MAG: hypothetical protein ACRDB1_10660 [Microcoleaceae cyanobacterium]